MGKQPVELKIYIVVSFLGMTLSFFGAVLNALMGQNFEITLACVFIGGVTFALFYNAVYSGNDSIHMDIIISILALIMYPILWFNSGGSHGPIPFMYLFNFVIAGIFIYANNIKLSLGINVVALIGVLSVEYMFPDLVFRMAPGLERLLSYSAVLIIVALSMFILAFTIIRSYNELLTKLRVTEESLEKLRGK